MKIPINLASQPFLRHRAMLAASIAVSLLLLGTLGVLISLALVDRSQLADVRQDVSRLNADIRRVQTDQTRLDAILRRPENAEVLERSVFINTLLQRKGISWTQILVDLEKVLPYNVRLIQVRPVVDGRNRVNLEMELGSDSPAPVIETLKALAGQPFGNPEMLSQRPPTQAEPLWRYRLSVTYEQRF
jgi:type IV pilus assembly protein PilN